MTIKTQTSIFCAISIILIALAGILTSSVQVTVFIALAVLIMMFLFIVFFIIKPIHAVKETVKKLSSGELEKGLLAVTETKERYPLEIGDLVRVCSDMKETLLAREIELSEKNASLELQNKKLQEYDILKNQFLATISHELKTPLNAIGGFTELIHGEILGPVNENQKEKLERILERSRELLNLINQILEFNKIAAGKVVIASDRVFLADLGAELLATFEPIASRKGLVLSLEGFMKNICIRGDYDKLKMLFNNLISNALKFTEKGSVAAGINLITEEFCILYVSDTGIGIPRDEWDHIFDMFYQVDGSSTRKYGGSGLGLAISKEIVEMHDGKLWIESNAGEGTTFYCKLPKFTEVTV